MPPVFILGPVIGVHTKVKPVPTDDGSTSSGDGGSSSPPPIVRQLADFQGIAVSGANDVAVFALRPLGTTDVPLVAIHVVVAGIPDGGVSPISETVTAEQLLDPANALLHGEWRRPADGEPETPPRVTVVGVPFGSSDWRTVFEFAS